MSTPLLVETVSAATTAELRQRRDAVAAADLIELRLDSVSDPDVAGALAGRRRPVIVTCRPAWEGGHFAGSEEERKRLLTEAFALGAEYVDVEWRARFEILAREAGQRIVLSANDFDMVPIDPQPAACHAIDRREIVKRAEDAPVERLRAARAGAQPRAPGRRRAIGWETAVTRALASRFGSA